MMLDTVSYTAVDKTSGNTETEDYNIYAYHAYVSELARTDTAVEAVKLLVEGLIKYAASAADYRASVIGSK